MDSTGKAAFVTTFVKEVLQESLRTTTEDGFDESEAVERIEKALDVLGVKEGFWVDDIKVSRDLSQAAVLLVLDDYYTELTVFAHDTDMSFQEVT